MSRLIAGMLIMGFIGAWLSSLALSTYDATTRPEVLRDGQYAFSFVTTVPVGWLLGSLGTAAIAAARRRASGPTNTQIALVSLGAVISTPVMLLLLLRPVAVSLGLVIEWFRVAFS